jgi:hypothetical protein
MNQPIAMSPSMRTRRRKRRVRHYGLLMSIRHPYASVVMLKLE